MSSQRLDPRGPLGLRVACPERGQQRIGGALQIAVLAGERQRQHVGADAELASERRGGGQPLEREHRLARRYDGSPEPGHGARIALEDAGEWLEVRRPEARADGEGGQHAPNVGSPALERVGFGRRRPRWR